MTSHTNRKLSEECLVGLDVHRRVSSASFPEAMTDMAITAIMVTSLPNRGLSRQSTGETSVLLVNQKGERLAFTIVATTLLEKGRSKQD